MFVIVDGYAYLVKGSTGYKVSVDVDGNVNVDNSDTISITTQTLYNYEDMYKKMNFDKAIKDLQKTYIATNANSDELGNLIDSVNNSVKPLAPKGNDIIKNSVKEIEGRLDDCVITFDKNGGDGTMAEVRKEVGDKYELPACTFTAPENKRFKEWKIGATSYDVGDEITLSTSITVKAIWENIPQYTITFDANSGTGTMDSVTKYEGEKYILPENSFTAPDDKKFKNWLIGEDELEVGAEITVEANTTVKANWEDDAEETPETTE